MRLLLICASIAACKSGGSGTSAPPIVGNTTTSPAEDNCQIAIRKVAPFLAEQGIVLDDEQRKQQSEDCHKNPDEPTVKCVVDAADDAAVRVCLGLPERVGARKTEAALQLNKLAKNSKTYFITNSSYVIGKTGPKPATPCCTQPDNTCAVETDWTKDPVWFELDFQIDEPNKFQYSYDSDGKTGVITAVGDLDCDGTMVTYRMDLSSQNGNVGATLHEPAPNSD